MRARIPLHSNENTARVQLATAFNLMRDLLAEVAPRLGRVTGRTYPAIGRRTT
ncbi:hypothetical protein [Nucisporomicrobium flavum]|uniref:hypothetical protein n=1 Tax=Nucisporomicrobium flavum TaxID=2785915 RepID=UPI001F304C60|nr:hypothetical protein [Nucisporomicrobium flavum]